MEQPRPTVRVLRSQDGVAELLVSFHLRPIHGFAVWQDGTCIKVVQLVDPNKPVVRLIFTNVPPVADAGGVLEVSAVWLRNEPDRQSARTTLLLEDKPPVL